MSNEFYPQLTDAPESVRRAVQQIFAQHYALAAKVAAPTANGHSSNTASGPQNVTTWLGVLAQPQFPNVETVTADPPIGDPFAQDGVIVYRSDLGVLRRFTGSTQTWATIATANLGTVTSVAATVPAAFSIAGSPITGAGTLAITEAALTYSRPANVNITPVTANANSTADQDLMSFTFGAGVLNTVNKTIHLYAAGLYTTQAGQTPTLRFRVFLGGVQLLSFGSNATTAAVTDMAWQVEAWITTASTGASGTVEMHGRATVTLGAAAGGVTETYEDTSTAVSSAIDLTAADVCKVTGRFQTQPGGPFNSFTQRQMITTLVN